MILDTPITAYLTGLLQTDGHYSKNGNKGSIKLELGSRDSQVIESLAGALPFKTTVTSRNRTTNYAADYTTFSLNINGREARDFFEARGVTSGKKSDSVVFMGTQFPDDYVRGLIDGDGSVGWTARGYPFISFITASKAMAEGLSNYIFSVTGVRRVPTVSSRDGAYSLMVTSDAAKLLGSRIYTQKTVSIPRKRQEAESFRSWEPSNYRFGVKRTSWTSDDDQIVIENTVEIAAQILDRTTSSVKTRKWRLTHSPT